MAAAVSEVRQLAWKLAPIFKQPVENLAISPGAWHCPDMRRGVTLDSEAGAARPSSWMQPFEFVAVQSGYPRCVCSLPAGPRGPAGFGGGFGGPGYGFGGYGGYPGGFPQAGYGSFPGAFPQAYAQPGYGGYGGYGQDHYGGGFGGGEPPNLLSPGPQDFEAKKLQDVHQVLNRKNRVALKLRTVQSRSSGCRGCSPKLLSSCGWCGNASMHPTCTVQGFRLRPSSQVPALPPPKTKQVCSWPRAVPRAVKPPLQEPNPQQQSQGQKPSRI